MNGQPYWKIIGSEGTSIAPDSSRQPITADEIAQAEAQLDAIAARIREAGSNPE